MASIYDEAQQMTPAELQKLVDNSVMAAQGIQTGGVDWNQFYSGMYPTTGTTLNSVPTFDKPGGDPNVVKKLPKFEPSDNVSAYTRDPNGDLTALTAISEAANGGIPLPRRDPRGYPLGVPGKIATKDPWLSNNGTGSLRGPGQQTGVNFIPGMVTGARPLPAAVKAASIFAPVMEKPITYTPAPLNYTPPAGSPNADFEREHGTGSLTQSMMNSSRWNTGY